MPINSASALLLKRSNPPRISDSGALQVHFGRGKRHPVAGQDQAVGNGAHLKDPLTAYRRPGDIHPVEIDVEGAKSRIVGRSDGLAVADLRQGRQLQLVIEEMAAG